MIQEISTLDESDEDFSDAVRSALPPRGGRARVRTAWALVVLAIGLIAFGALGFLRVQSVRSDLEYVRDSAARIREFLRAGAIAEAQMAADRTLARARRAESSAHGLVLDFFGPIPLAGRQVSAIREITGAAYMSAKAVVDLVDGAARAPLVANLENFEFNGSIEPLIVGLRPALPALRRVEVELAEARSIAERIPKNRLFGKIAEARDQLLKDLRTAQKQIEVTLGMSTWGEKLIAPGAKPIRLLVLSQDTWELRPSGGFIGSYGVLRLDRHGVELEKYDDATILPPPDPPMFPTEPLKSFLSRPWRFTGVGWWPDFPTSARSAQTMFKRVGGHDVDGVLGITNEFLEDLLKGFGSVTVPGYPDVLTSENIEWTILYHVELKRPLDTPRKKFLIELTKILFDRLSSAKGKEAQGLIDALSIAVRSRDAQFYFNDPDAQKAFGLAGWDGALTLPPAHSDFLSPIDANFGADKANKWVKKKFRYRVYWNKAGDPMAELVVDTENFGDRSEINPWYVSYLRIYSRPGVKLTPKTRTEKAITESRLEEGFGLLAAEQVIHPKTTGRRVFNYRLPDSVVRGAEYVLVVRPQAGTPDDRFEIVNELGEKRQTVSFGAREGDKTLTLDLVRPEDRGNVFKRLWRKYRGWLRR